MPTAKKSYHVAIVGATGAVGEELLRVLERRAFPVERLVPLCSERSAGGSVSFRGEKITAERLSRDSFSDVDVAFFSAGGNVSREYASAPSQLRAPNPRGGASPIRVVGDP